MTFNYPNGGQEVWNFDSTYHLTARSTRDPNEDGTEMNSERDAEVDVESSTHRRAFLDFPSGFLPMEQLDFGTIEW
jgi:hypothetical protein